MADFNLPTDETLASLAKDETVAGLNTTLADSLEKLEYAILGKRLPGKYHGNEHPTVLYGYDWDMSNKDPESAVTYVEDNKGFTPAGLTTSNTFAYGGWQDAFFMPKPCMLGFDGSVENYLNQNDYTLNEDGSRSGVVTSTTANAMVEWPEMWVRRWKDGSVYHFRVSDGKRDGFQAYANMRDDGSIVRFYTPIYNGSVDELGRLRSLSGKTVQYDVSIEKARGSATALGQGWDIERVVDRLLFDDLCVLLGKSMNTQKVFGTGVSAGAPYETTGRMDGRGMFCGTLDSSSSAKGNGYGVGNEGVKVFGMEHPWGNYWHRVVGMSWKFERGDDSEDNTWPFVIKLTDGIEDGSQQIGYNNTGDGYVEISGSDGGEKSKDGTPVILAGEYGIIPVQSASDPYTTFTCDNASGYGEKWPACFGGYRSMGPGAGAFCRMAYNITDQPKSSSSSSSSRYYVSDAPSYK